MHSVSASHGTFPPLSRERTSHLKYASWRAICTKASGLSLCFFGTFFPKWENTSTFTSKSCTILTKMRKEGVKENVWHQSPNDNSNKKTTFWLHSMTYMFIFCLAFSISLLTSGVMLKRSFWGMGRGIMGARRNWVLCLLRKTWPAKSVWAHHKHEETLV